MFFSSLLFKMAATCCLATIVPVLPASWGVHAGAEEGTVDPRAALNRVLDAMEKGLGFYEREFSKLNLDAIIGTRLVEGQLTVLLKHINTPGGSQVSADILSKIQSLRSKADHISDIATPIVERTQPTYYNRIGAILRPGFWSLDYGSRNVDRALIRPPAYDGEAMHEDDSDDCLTELLGSGETTRQQCRVSRKCWNLMTESGYKGYSLSHEIFYLEIGQQTGCFKSDMNHILDELQSGFCANMYAEARHIARTGYRNIDRDLFMELPALCGVLGYRQFFRDDWLDNILSWQWANGCWGSVKQEIPRSAKDRFKRDSGATTHRRFKREEKRFTDGCLCHRTAVALGALSQYVRYIVEYLNAVNNKL